MKKILTSLAIAVTLAGAAHAGDAGCTAADLQAKGLEVATAMQSIAATNPTLMQEIAADLQGVQAKAATAQAGDYSGVCKAYDDILAKMQ